ncbi:MAG: hypothetical protein COX45_01405, partial [Candidatus Portnoybacteria bacterium CG23_combo_of_CG06-09_8_20_14_all_44_36]
WRSRKLNARAGKKEGGWGEGIFARPRFPIPFFPPPPNFVFRFAKCAAEIKGVALVPPAHTRATTRNSLKFVC